MEGGGGRREGQWRGGWAELMSPVERQKKEGKWDESLRECPGDIL